MTPELEADLRAVIKEQREYIALLQGYLNDVAKERDTLRFTLGMSRGPKLVIKNFSQEGDGEGT